MIDLVLIICSIIAIFALIIWILSKITVPLVKAGISMVFIIFIGGIVCIIGFAFWAMGFSAFAVLGLLLVALVLKVS